MMNQQTIINTTNNYQLNRDVQHDLAVLKKLEKWRKTILNRIEEKLNSLKKIDQPTLSLETHQKAENLKSKHRKNSTEMIENIIKNQLKHKKANLEQNDESNQILEDQLEQKYKREYYDVIVCGNGLSEYSNIYERIDEIKRCTGVESPEMVIPMVDKSSKISKLKIRVKSYNDFKSLLKNWPSDSFKTGVKIQSTLPNLKVIIENVDRKININQSNVEIKELRNRYGLYNIKRIHNHYNRPCNKLLAKCEKISDYIYILKHGITIGKNEKKYLVVPYIVNCKLCSNCGSLNHQKIDCSMEQSCLKCAQHGHKFEECKSLFDKCANCSGPHKCVSDRCEKFSKKKIHLNRYVINILRGEKFILNNSDILVSRKDPKRPKTNTNQKNNLKDKIECFVSSKLNLFDSKLDSLKQIMKIQSASVQELKMNLKSVHENLPDIQSIKDLESSLKSLHETTSNNDLNKIIQTSMPFFINPMKTYKTSLE